MAQKLLLADDSVTIQRVIELTFADENIDVIAVGDGDEAIARIESEPPDIVLADVGMPGRDGYEVAAHVKHTDRLSHIPVLLLTGAFEPVDQQRAASAGSDGVLAKPFEPQMVIARVKELLSSSPSAGSAAAPGGPAEPEAQSSSAPGAAQSAAHEPHLDEYFDKLDAAFANMSHGSSAAPAASVDHGHDVPGIDWFGSRDAASTTPADMPASFASPQPSASAESGEALPPPPATFAGPPPLPAVAQSSVPTLSDAFAAILAAEQSDTPATPVHWPTAPREIGEDVLEEVTRRVLERMSDRVVHETVAGIVSSVAERLVREEIERIKASIK